MEKHLAALMNFEYDYSVDHLIASNRQQVVQSITN